MKEPFRGSIGLLYSESSHSGASICRAGFLGLWNQGGSLGLRGLDSRVLGFLGFWGLGIRALGFYGLGGLGLRPKLLGLGSEASRVRRIHTPNSSVPAAMRMYGWNEHRGLIIIGIGLGAYYAIIYTKETPQIALVIYLGSCSIIAGSYCKDEDTNKF